MTLDIQPTAAKPSQQPPYATEIVGRSPKFKTHTQIGHAKSAIKNRAPVCRTYVKREQEIHPDGTWEWVETTITYDMIGSGNVGSKIPQDFYARMFRWDNVESRWVYVPEFSYEQGDDPITW